MCAQPSLIKPLDNQLSLADVDTIKVIGKGSGGIVQLVRHKWTGQFFALKVMHDLKILLCSFVAFHSHLPSGICIIIFISRVGIIILKTFEQSTTYISEISRG